MTTILESTEQMLANYQSEIHQNLTYDDFSELLNFPFHEYLTNENEVADSHATGNINIEVSTGEKWEGQPKKGISEEMETLESALSINRALQVKMREILDRLNSAMDENSSNEEKLQLLLNEEIAKREMEINRPRFMSRGIFLSPYFQDVHKMVSPLNEDAKMKLKNRDINAYLNLSNIWFDDEINQLMKGVYETSLKYVLKPYTNRLDHLKDKLLDYEIPISEARKFKKEMCSLEKKIKKEGNKPPEEIISEGVDHINWWNVSTIYLHGIRSDEECKTKWNNYVSVFVNKEPFSRAENRKLKELVEIYGGENWDLIAKLLQTGRSAFQCMQRFKTHIENKNTSNFWTPEEDAKLIKLVDSYRVKNYIPWTKVSSYMEDHTYNQIVQRYCRCICREKTPWTKEEDAMILACAKKYGNCWEKMMKFLPGRYSDAICFRYDGYLDLSLKHTEWSDVEIIRLLRLVKQYGYDKKKYGKWNYILKEMSGRGRAECYRQAKRLFHLNPDLEKNMIYNIDELQKPKWEKQNANFSLQRQEVRKTAVETLNSALEKIFPTLNEKVDLETLDLSSNDGVIILKKINAELFKDWDEKKFTVLQPRYCIKNPEDTEIQIEDTERGSESNLENDENTEKETNLNKKEKEVRTLKVREFKVLRLDKNEKNWIHKVLQTKIQEIADFRFLLPYDSDEMDLSLSASAESSIYQNYLQQQFSCSSNEDIEFVCNEVDYNISVPDIIRHFIQPPCPESQMAVLSPNLATLGGMVNILASRRMLRRTANFVDHSIPYLRYSFGLTEDRPQCIKCCAVETAIECGEKFVAVVNKMKSNYIYPSEEMKNAAMVETKNSAIQNEECCCNELATSKDEVDLLIKRFMSLFLWPFLLSSSELSTEQELIISNIQDSETEETESEENSVDEESSSQSSVEPTRKKRKTTRRKNIKISKLRSTNLLQRRRRSCVKQKPPPCITISDSDEIEIFFCRMESEENSVDEENINQCCVKPPRKKRKTTLRKNIKNIKTKLRSTNLLQRRRRSCVKQKPPPCIAISDSDEIEIVFEA